MEELAGTIIEINQLEELNIYMYMYMYIYIYVYAYAYIYAKSKKMNIFRKR